MIRALQYFLCATAVFLIGLAVSAPAAVADAKSDAMVRAMAAVRADRWEDAVTEAKKVGPEAQSFVEWRRLRAGVGAFGDYIIFTATHQDWPGMPLLQKRGEPSIPKGADPARVVAYFKFHEPQTGIGALRLAEAYKALGQEGDREIQLVLAWRTFSLSAELHDAYLANAGRLLESHHRARMDMLLWRGLTSEAERMMPLMSADWQKLARARIALRKRANGVDALVEAVPNALSTDPGLVYERFLWRARKGLTAGALELILIQSESAEGLGEADHWAKRRRSMARAEMRAGRHKTAYRLAANHGLVDGSDFADLEWLSGYLSLRFLNNPEAALDHFQRFRSAVFTPISLGRAGYWQGRALEAMGDAQGAKLAYAKGAEFQTSFYGLLAAERAGLPMLETMTGKEDFPPWQSASFLTSSVLKTALVLFQAGERSLAERFMVHLGESLSREELGQLGDMALALGDPHIAVMIGKQAARQGHTIERAYYALHPLGLAEIPVDAELALSIARRESEFDPVVVSGAGARGLMQVMPGTARDVAKELDLAYSRDKLTSDPDYNVRLGTAFLAGLEKRYGKNRVLVSAAYNAGPGRADRWMDERGDPRSGRIDVVDWIEHIPFRETRNYVMRVMESLPVYRAQLTGKTAPIRLSEELSAR